MLGRVIVVAMLCLAGWWGYQHYSKRVMATAETPAPVERKALLRSAPTSSFTCDGRKHCSQMTSCAEATYFLKNCPGTKMDGDRDGVPCEEQWCTGILDGVLR